MRRQEIDELIEHQHTGHAKHRKIGKPEPIGVRGEDEKKCARDEEHGAKEEVMDQVTARVDVANAAKM